MKLEQFAEDLIKHARKAGADEADVFIQSGKESEITSRMQKLENIKESSFSGYGIRVFKKSKLGFCFGSNFTSYGMKSAAQKAVLLANETSEDEFNGIPKPANNTKFKDPKLFDANVEKKSVEGKIEYCLKMEQAMFEYDKRIFNSEGAAYSDITGVNLYTDSNGRRHSYKSSYCYTSCSPVAKENGKFQAGWWASYKRFLSELDSPENVAKTAAERTVRMLGARAVKTIKAPVVCDTITATSILASIAEAVNGKAVLKKTTYLAGRLEGIVTSPLLTIVDDGILPKGVASAPIDGEGIPTNRREIISKGRLVSYMYDSYTGRKSKTESTGNAKRSYNSLPGIGPFNFYIEKGQSSFNEIIGSVKNGLYLTNVMGFGANPVTGDYSLGASGLWIENGEIAYPVEGITIAANILSMLKNVDMVGNDLKFLGPISSPTLKVSEMIISGK